MKNKILIGLVTALLLAFLLSPFASANPDGLDRVLKDFGLEERSKTILVSPAANYVFPGIKNEKLATGIAGVFGTLLTFGFAWFIGKKLGNK
ncbi:PDGLE domain-containing protein [Carboxydothermus pertinax]|uniref:Membrane protein n=1 Tax=Carboxydothermus pertinax TaxID=870242 RepID=A0A1L8CXB7_9THEO|nr:PDGLE domain-containing protein [Carboxydothermus pertinax]GAV23575.1 membrane protein [Carboxydothermus pertinax]